MSYNFQQNIQPQAQQNEHSMGSLLLGALFGAVSPVADAAYDIAEGVGQRRADIFQKKAIEAANNNVALGQKNAINSAFGQFAQGMDLERTQPQKRYLSFDYTPRRARGMAMAA